MGFWLFFGGWGGFGVFLHSINDSAMCTLFSHALAFAKGRSRFEEF